MDFLVKTYNVPFILDDKNEPQYKEVVLNEDNQVNVEKIVIEHSFEIPPKANEIEKFNKMQLTIAKSDNNIKLIKKKILCRPNRDYIG